LRSPALQRSSSSPSPSAGGCSARPEFASSHRVVREPRDARIVDRLKSQETMMGGHQVPGTGSGDDGYDEEGYDESQRAEILEATRDGPTDGTILTDLSPDLGEDPDDEIDALSDVIDDEDVEADPDSDPDDNAQP
jgi:hypothetical protein